MNTKCIRKIRELYEGLYFQYYHQYQCYLFCYTSLLKIIEHTYFKYKKEDILTGLKYLLHKNMIFSEYKHNCVDLIRRGILENMFAIYDEDILDDDYLHHTDFAVESLCMELEDELLEIKEEQDMYLYKVKHPELYTIIEEEGSDGNDDMDNDI